MADEQILRWDIRDLGHGDFVVTFTIVLGDLRTSDLAEIEVPDSVQSANRVFLSGRGPQWLYAFLTPKIGADTLAIHEPRWSTQNRMLGVITKSRNEDDLGRLVQADLAVNEVTLVEANQWPVTALPKCQIEWVQSWHEGYDILNIVLRSTEQGSAVISPSQLRDLRLPNRHAEPAADDQAPGIVLTGSSPIWVYSRLGQLAADRGGWLGYFLLYENRTVVLRGTFDGHAVGDTFLETAPKISKDIRVGPASKVPLDDPLQHCIAIIGPADSGKSVLCHGIRIALSDTPGGWLMRANPDGSAMYPAESKDFKYATGLRYKVRREWAAGMAERYVDHIRNLKPRSDWLFVDTGGKASPELKRILGACSHAVLLSRSGETQASDREAFAKLCDESNTLLLGDVRSDLTLRGQNLRIENGQILGGLAHLDREHPMKFEAGKSLVDKIFTLLPRSPVDPKRDTSSL